MGERTAQEWADIHKDLARLDDVTLGRIMREYIADSVHGGFDGFESRDVTGIRRFLTDFILYAKNSQ